MSIYKKFAESVAVIGLSQVLLAMRELLLLLLINKFLDTTEYGHWAQANVILLIIEPVFTLGLTASFTRFLAAEKNRQEIQEGFYSVMLIMVACALGAAAALAVLAQPISNGVFEGEGTASLRLIALAAPFDALYIACLSYFLTFRQMRTYAAFVILRCIGEIAIAAGFLWFGGDIETVILAFVIAVSLSGVAAFGLIASRIGIRRPDFRQVGKYLRFGLPLVPVTLLFWVVQRSGTLVVGSFLGPEVVGIYSAGYAIGTVLAVLRLPLLLSLSPTLSKLWDEGKVDGVKTHLKYALEYGLMLGIPAAVGISVLGKQLFEIFASDEFAWEGSLVIPFVAASMILYQVYGVLGGEVLKLTRKTGIMAFAWIVAAVASIGLNVVLVPRYGFLAAAVTTLFAYALVTGITLYFSLCQLPVGINWRLLSKIMAASGVMAAVILLIHPVRVWEVAAVISLGLVIYGAALVLLKGVGKTEWNFALDLCRKRLPSLNHRSG